MSVRHNRELDLLKQPGVYRFVIRANCDEWNGYAELFLKVTWHGNSETIRVAENGPDNGGAN